MKTVVAEAMQRGAQRIVGSYRATAKNGMVRNLFGDLGFERMESGPDDAERWDLLAASFHWRETEILIQQ
jgi:predicted enzyme involved in methoxymalonyl-ACP biosynthesis